MKLAVSVTPCTMQELKKTKALSPKQVNMFGAALLPVIREALSIPFDKLPSYPHKKPPMLDPNVPKRVKALKSWRDSYAKKLNIDSSIITPKNIMTTLAVKNRKISMNLSRLMN
jgi:ribonuclease D